MPTNPSLSRAECNLHAGLPNQDGINNPKLANNEGYNTFDMSSVRQDTMLFDEIRPIDMRPALAGDVKRLRNSHDLRTYTLSSPLLSDVELHRSYFQVPWSVIMPNTWEYALRTPIQGEDVVQSDVFPVVDLNHLFGYLNKLLSSFSDWSIIMDILPTSSTPLYVTSWFCKVIYLFQSLFGRSSVPRLLKCRIPHDSLDFDVIFGRLCTAISTHMGNNAASYTNTDGDEVIYSVTSPHDVANLIREYTLYGDGSALNVGFVYFDTATEEDYAPFVTAIRGIVFGDDSSTQSFDIFRLFTKSYNYDLMPVIAYQCLCAQFFTNDKIDDIYSAKLWQQNALSFIRGRFVEMNNSATISVNGVSFECDAYSGYVLRTITSVDVLYDCFRYLDYFQELVTIRQSMRYGDYFTSGRRQPLGVGNVNAPVVGNNVSAIDMNKSLWMQRFTNAVNRAKQSIYDYMESMDGVLPQRREPQPNFISSEVYSLGGQEVENTADNQGNIVTLLRNGESRYMFEVFVDEPSFIIGVDYFTTRYCYTDVSHRVAFLDDRLQWFNHFMQHIGDQAVELRELSGYSLPGGRDPMDSFAYQLRYAEFKNSFNDACGGFLADDTQLKSWSLLFDFDLESSRYGSHLNSAFIRNHNCDFDKLYSSLTGDNFSNYFHFIKSIRINDDTNSKQQSFPSLL